MQQLSRALAVLLALLVTGCSYSGMQGVFDYAGAAGDLNNPWNVDVSNFTACKRRPWDPDDKGQASRVCVNTNFLDCGANPDHPPLGSYMGDPQVVQDKSTGRFYWAAMNPQQTGFCLSRSTTTDPFAIDRQLWLPASNFAGSDRVDRDMLVVTSNKIGISNYDTGSVLPPPYNMGPARRVTKVLNKADFDAGVTVRTASITHDLDHALMVNLGAIAGNGGAFTWTVPHAHSITVGIVTGVPGENGGINTASATIDRPWTWTFRPHPIGTPQAGTGVDLRADQQSVLRYRQDNGNGELWVVTPIQENGLTQLSVDILNQISPTFAPAMVQNYRFRTGNSHMMCPSLAVGPGPQNRGLVGWTSINTNQWPMMTVAAFNRNGGTPKVMTVANPGPGSQYFGVYGPRMDYCPQGMVGTYDNGSGYTEEWLYVGFNRLVAGAYGAFTQPFSLFGCAQVGGDLCTRPATGR